MPIPLKGKKERVVVTFYGFEYSHDKRMKIIEIAGCQPALTTLTGSLNKLEFEVEEPYQVMNRLRNQIKDITVTLGDYAYGYGYSNHQTAGTTYVPAKPKRKLRVTTDSGTVHIATAFDEDVAKEICWIRDHGVYSAKIEPDEIAKIEILPEDTTETEGLKTIKHKGTTGV